MFWPLYVGSPFTSSVLTSFKTWARCGAFLETDGFFWRSINIEVVADRAGRVEAIFALPLGEGSAGFKSLVNVACVISE